MQPTLSAVVNRTEEWRVASASDIDALCDNLAKLSVYTVHVSGETGELGPTLDIVVESDRALVDFHDIGRGIKLASRDETCVQRGVVRLASDSFPHLELDQIEVHRRDLIAPVRAISILRHYLSTGEPIDLVRWPPDDWSEWGDAEFVSEISGDEIRF